MLAYTLAALIIISFGVIGCIVINIIFKHLDATNNSDDKLRNRIEGQDK